MINNMFSKLLSASAVGLTFLSNTGSSGTIATATFGGDNGLDGYVMVDDGTLTIMINASGLAANNFSGVTGGATCFTGGLKYHIHEFWAHNETTDYLNENSMCGGDYTGGHWDPWLACGGATGNDYCAGKSNVGCVTGSSALEDADGVYTCSSDNYDVNAYSCEVGDWNGKYGLVELDDMNVLSLSASSSYEVDGADIIGMSVVFHCNGGDRAFCAEFVEDGTGSATRDSQSDASDMEAMFDDSGDNYVMFSTDGTTEIELDFDILTFPDSGCDELEVRVYNDWSGDDDYSTDCDDLVGDFYDPTVTCAPGSDSSFCNNGTRCNGTYTYSCDYDTDADRFLCAPGDLTGKFGSLTVSDGSASVSESDDLQIDLQLLSDKSVVVQCSDTWEILACGSISTITNDTDSSEEDSAVFALPSMFMLLVCAVWSLF